jgi:hypothetical protein
MKLLKFIRWLVIYTCYFWQLYCTIFCATIYLMKQEINLHCYLWLFDLHHGSCFQHDYPGDSQLLLDNTLSGSVHTNKFIMYVNKTQTCPPTLFFCMFHFLKKKYTNLQDKLLRCSNLIIQQPCVATHHRHHRIVI